MVLINTGGSARLFYRVETGRGKTAVRMCWDGGDNDWDYFLALNKIKQIRDFTPSVIEAKRKENWAIVRDCGEYTLKDLMEKYKKDTDKQKLLLNKVAQKLKFWQGVKPPKDNIVATRVFGINDLLWESDYFREHIYLLFPKTQNLFLSERFDEERNEIAHEVNFLPKCLMHRDFQSENIVLDAKENVSFVDIQGARMGAKYYDIASLAFDPYMYHLMTDELRLFFLEKTGVSKGEKTQSLYLCALQRLMQAMGAYGNLSTNKNKPQYRQFIRPAAVLAFDICKKLEKYPTILDILLILSS